MSASIIIVGGGLSGCVLAWYLADRRPEISLTLLESNREVPRSRTWSFHAADLRDEWGTIQLLVSRSWKGYDVYFPQHARTMNEVYASIRPETLESAVREKLGAAFRTSTPVARIGETFVELQSGETLRADLVVDARGINESSATVAYQKFHGLHLRFDRPHGLVRPILMDATVPQLDGYRFIYVLPWNESEALIEDTRYSSTSDIDTRSYSDEIVAYAERKGWGRGEVLSQETGALPIPLAKPYDTTSRTKFGAAAGFYHPVTGYSLPDVVRLSRRISSLSEFSPEAFADSVESYREERRHDLGFFLLLNRMMFGAARPEDRHRIFDRFYRLPESLIRNFYRGQLKFTERVRILTGKPPVPVLPAIKEAFAWGR